MTAGADGALRPIGADSVRRLCAGQVIVDLATSVKELVENSLDAGATQIEVRLRDSGLTSITVVDNGQGIAEAGHATACRRHWTSKIRSFEDVEGVATFGFRGEALSSLCAVGSVTVTTATRETAPMGVQLEYAADGELAAQTAVARERGTTVSVTGLFAKWPVRLQDLRKNIRREYLRLVALVEQYAIVSDGVRLTLTNQTRGGAATAAVRTQPQADRLARTVAVCGAALRPHLASLEHRAEGATTTAAGPPIAISGHVSKATPEAGRSAADKQYFFVNGRPCDFPRAKRLVNEMYRAHCPTRFPVYAISIAIDARSIDVNLTPDKRAILVRHEPQLLDALRHALTRVFEPDESAFSVSRVQTQLVPPPDDAGPSESAAPAARGAPSESAAPAARAVARPVTVPTTVPGVVRCSVADTLSADTSSLLKSSGSANHPSSSANSNSAAAAAQKRPISSVPGEDQAPEIASKRATSRPQVVDQQSSKNSTGRLPAMVIGSCRNRVQNDAPDWSGVRQRMQAKRAREAQRSRQQQERTEAAADELEHGGVGNASDPERAHAALARLIHKRDFGAMEVVGQFNRGFIIARLGADLYIVDQHASDEKHNFEQLQQQAVISSQPLIRPQTLELNVVDEGVAIAFQDVLLRNGFHVRVTEDAEPGRRVALLSQPFIDQTLFTEQDLLELIGRLAAGPESAAPRCDRARRMFASRACRKSIMIGDALTHAQMRAVVHRLGALDHPWNCPHGRPTMRHLYRLPP
ncbi:ATP-binding mismatch repair protein [Coemansia javaensis]|uniref:ATP-binding mismatch repair protein n=1 Tax=Coemansia javaensis TaxID=2761396 RepID=A0A9W8LFF9_9FUNG|nr:ATP-binding mismatch repair protein [Coemansia javaensis]